MPPNKYTAEEIAAFDAAYVPENARRDAAFSSAVVSQIVPGGELDPERQKFMGQRRVAGTVALDLSGVDRAIKTGDPQLLEALDFGAGSDGVPFVHFIDTKGESQYVNVSSREWGAMLTQRSQAREELMFRRNAAQDRAALSSQWNNMITQMDIPDLDKEIYGLMWQASPKTAIEALQQDHAQRTVANQKAELLGDERARSEDAAAWVNTELEYLGITQLPPSTSTKQIDSIMGMLLKDRLTDNPLHRYRGRDVTDAVAKVGVVRDGIRFTNNARTYGEWQKSVKLQVTTLPKPASFFNSVPKSIDVVAQNERLPMQAAEPDMSIYQNWKNLGKTSNDMRDVLGHYVMVASLVNTQYKPPDMSSWKKRNNNSGAEYFDVDEAAMAATGPTFDEIGRIFRMQGWKPLSEEERELLAIPLISSIEDMRKHTDYITPVFYQSPPDPAGSSPDPPGPPQDQGQRSKMTTIIDILNSGEGNRRVGEMLNDFRSTDPRAAAAIESLILDKGMNHVMAVTSLLAEVQSGNPSGFEQSTVAALNELHSWVAGQMLGRQSPPYPTGQSDRPATGGTDDQAGSFTDRLRRGRFSRDDLRN